MLSRTEMYEKQDKLRVKYREEAKEKCIAEIEKRMQKALETDNHRFEVATYIGNQKGIGENLVDYYFYDDIIELLKSNGFKIEKVRYSNINYRENEFCKEYIYVIW